MEQRNEVVITLETFIISDTHFGHENILRHEPVRKEALGHNPDKRMVELWNRRVGRKADVFHLGDFAWKSEGIERFAPKLNGTKYLLRGNHDKAAATYLQNGFAEVIDFSASKEAAYHIATVEGVTILFSHYPIVSDGFDEVHWPFLSEIFEREGCDVNIHGHVHSMKLDCERCVNASVEAIGFAPVPLSELLRPWL